MSCLGCNLIETAPVTLRDGSIVCTSCPPYFRECEARETMQMSRPDIDRYFLLVEKARGVKAKNDLRNEMIALHKAKTVL